MPKEIYEIADYTLAKVYEMIDYSYSPGYPDSGAKLARVLAGLAKIMSVNAEGAEVGAPWFENIILRMAGKEYQSPVGYRPQFNLLTIGTPSLLEVAVRSNNFRCMHAISRFFDVIQNQANHLIGYPKPKAKPKLGDAFVVLSPPPHNQSLIDFIFLSGQFPLVEKILSNSTVTIRRHIFPLMPPEKGPDWQCEALYFLIKNNNPGFREQANAITPLQDAHSYINKKIDFFVNKLKTETGDKVSLYLVSRLLVWVDCDHLLGNRDRLISTYNQLKMIDTAAIPVIINQLLKKARGSHEVGVNPYAQVYSQLDDRHKGLFLKEFFQVINDKTSIRNFLNSLSVNDQQGLANHCANYFSTILHHVYKFPYRISGQQVTAGDNPLNHTLFHYWLMSRHTQDQQIIEWCSDNGMKAGWQRGDKRYELLRKTCFYYRERASRPETRFRFMGIAGGIEKSEKLSAIRKLHTRLLDKTAKVYFTQNEADALMQSDLGTICKGYKEIVKGIIEAPPDFDTPVRLSIGD